MNAPIVDLAQVITDTLNRPGAFTPALNATRQYEIAYDLPTAVAAPLISVVPGEDLTAERISRDAWRHALKVLVAIQKKIADDANAEKDVLVTLAETVCEFLKTNLPERNDQRPEALTDATVKPFIQHPLLRQNKLFSCGVLLTFASHR